MGYPFGPFQLGSSMWLGVPKGTNKTLACGSTKKSPSKLNATENKFDTGDLFTNGENHRGKTPLGEFKVITSENSLLSKQAVISKRNPST